MFFKKIKDFFFKGKEKDTSFNKLNIEIDHLKDNKSIPMIKKLKK